MTTEAYRPVRLDDALSRVIEECAEVIKIGTKAQRFGLNDLHPVKQKKNIDLLVDELADVKQAAEDFFAILYATLPLTPPKKEK